jgi:murein endopeptidase
VGAGNVTRIAARLTVAVSLLAIAFVPANADSACKSRAVGKPWDGRLVCGVQLAAKSDTFVTWDFPLVRSPNRGWRRWGTQKLVDRVQQLATDYAAKFPGSARLVVGDLSRTHGGPFGREYGGIGHGSHQNGLDVDIYYPRRDGLETSPEKPKLIARGRAQWLVDQAARGADRVFIGPHTRLHRPTKRVQYLVHHDNHLHLRIRP